MKDANKILESMEVRSKQKAVELIDALKRQGRYAHYIEFIIDRDCTPFYVVYYRPLA